jgi:hyperosmotically inducible periplasmic protein
MLETSARPRIAVLCWLLALAVLAACASGCNSDKASVKDNVVQALKQGGFADVNVDEDRDKGVITLKGEVKSDDDKARAGQLAHQQAGSRVVANELAVRPPGAESTAKDVQSSTDDAIKDHWKAAVAANHWGNQHISADVKNGVITLKGAVDRPSQRAAMEKTASTIPGVHQVVNETEVKGAKRKSRAAE